MKHDVVFWRLQTFNLFFLINQQKIMKVNAGDLKEKKYCLQLLKKMMKLFTAMKDISLLYGLLRGIFEKSFRVNWRDLYTWHCES